jgi:hypothetical protein
LVVGTSVAWSTLRLLPEGRLKQQRLELADLLLLDGDPTRNIEDLRKVALVMTRGKLIYPNEINQALGVKPFVTNPPKLRRLN